MTTRISLKSNTHGGMFQSVATVDRTKIHLFDANSGSRITLPASAFPFCTLDSISIVTITVTQASVEPEEPTLPGLEGMVLKPSRLS